MKFLLIRLGLWRRPPNWKRNTMRQLRRRNKPHAYSDWLMWRGCWPSLLDLWRKR